MTPLPPFDPELFCPDCIADQAAPGSVLQVSVTPVLGSLLPLGPELFVDPAGRVGLGTLTPAATLDVAGNLNVRDAGVRVVGGGSATGLTLGTAGAFARPHLLDEDNTLLGGAVPEAELGSPAYALRTADATLGAVLTTGVGGPLESTLSSDGPLGAQLELPSGGPGHRLHASAGLGAGSGQWSVTSDSVSGTMTLSGGGVDGDGQLWFEDSNGSTAARLDAGLDIASGGALTLFNDAGTQVVEGVADLSGGASLACLGPASGAGLNAGSSLGLEPSINLWGPTGVAAVDLSARTAPGGAELRIADAAGSETVVANAGATVSLADASVDLINNSGGPGSLFVGASLRTPETTKSSVLQLKGPGGLQLDVHGQSGGGTAGGGISIQQAGLTWFELYDNALTLFDPLTGAATIKYDGVTGLKSAVVETSAGARHVYCIEGAEVWFEDAGTARLVEGSAVVPLDPVFLQTIVVNEQQPLRAWATARDGSGVWVEKGSDRITLHAMPGGAVNGLVDWRVQAVRRGAEGKRMEPWIE